MLLFAIGLLMCLRYGGVVYNGYFDQSQLKEFEEVITNKYTTASRSSTDYHLTVSPWRVGIKGWSFIVSEKDYFLVNVGQTRCLIYTKSGKLGFEWVTKEKIEITTLL
jgi:hypothetical protein